MHISCTGYDPPRPGGAIMGAEEYRSGIFSGDWAFLKFYRGAIL